MTNKIVHTKALDILIKNSDVKVGEVYYRKSYNQFILIRGFGYSKYSADKLVVRYSIYKDGKFPEDSEEHYDLHDLVGHNFEYVKKLTVEEGQTAEEAVKACLDEVLEAFQNPEKYLKIVKDLDNSEDNGMIPVDQKSFYDTAQTLLQTQSNKVAILHDLIRKKMDALSNVFSELQDKIAKVSRIIGAIELYLGVNEEIVQIQQGEPAPVDTQISLRQMILYMDEEAAILDNGGIGWTRVEEFDTWLQDKSHLERVFPEPKGIVVLRASRQDKYHSDNYAYNASMRDKNLFSYLLIRNGDNLYRVYTSIKMGQRFFPTLEESAHIEELFAKAAEQGQEDSDAESEKFVAVRNTLLVQGLIDRTEIFLPLAHRIDFFSPDTYAPGGIINMIRDDELTLPSGKLSFNNWKIKINSKIDRGSRIFLSPPPYWDYYGSKGEVSSRRFTVWQTWYPGAPASGLYTVEEIMKGEKGSTNKFRILYMPDKYVGPFGDERKRRMSFLLYKDDATVLNYDMISLDDLNYYIENRTDRHNFLSMLPVLIGLKKTRLQEIEDEKGFVSLISSKYGFTEKAVWKAIDWWKYKVIWKRPIRKDDAKAWRMISKKLSGKEQVYFTEE
jgi:hypothetical protein